MINKQDIILGYLDNYCAKCGVPEVECEEGICRVADITKTLRS